MRKKQEQGERKMVYKGSQILESKVIAFTYNTKSPAECDHIRACEDY